MGHLKTFFAQGVENLISQISKSSNSRGRPGGGVMLKFRIDRYIMYRYANKLRRLLSCRYQDVFALLIPPCSGLKIYFTGPSDKMSGDVEFGSDICPMTFSSVLTRK